MRIPLIYILGVGHTGSTLLDLLLSNHSQIAGVGELKFFEFRLGRNTEPRKKVSPHRARTRRRCTCQQQFDECEFWRPITSKLRQQFGSEFYQINSDDQEEFREKNETLFREIQNHSNKRFIVDNSKSPRRLARLISHPSLNVQVVHAVRDARAVAYSCWSKGQREGAGSEPKYDLFHRAHEWDRTNRQFQQEFSGPNYQLIRYEDLVTDPVGELANILESMGLAVEANQTEYWRTVHHDVDGNHMRHECKPIEPDTHYLENLSWIQWLRISRIARRGLRHFGYHLIKRSFQPISQSEHLRRAA